MITRWLTFFCGAACCVFLSTAAENRDPAQWEKEIQSFERQDHTNPPPQGAVLFIGSSSIRFWTNLSEAFPQITTVRRGFGGSHLPDATAFAERIIFPYKPSKIVLYEGENDIARGDSPREVFDNFRTFVQKVRTELPSTPIYFISIKPAPVRWRFAAQEKEANQLIRSYCERDASLHFIDLWPALLPPGGQPDPSLYRADRLHHNAKGYEIWRRVIGMALGLGAEKGNQK